MLIKQKQHIAQTIILCLTVVLLLPSIVKFSHILSHHEHEICEDTSTTHFHEVDVDCEFYKFKINTNFYVAQEQVEIIPNDYNNSLEYSYYAFIRSNKRTTTHLRGPPSLV